MPCLPDYKMMTPPPHNLQFSRKYLHRTCLPLFAVMRSHIFQMKNLFHIPVHIAIPFLTHAHMHEVHIKPTPLYL